jgi:hypothetical protein
VSFGSSSGAQQVSKATRRLESLPDQAAPALHGVLAETGAFGLELIELRSYPANT